jgi:hypothetical protein
VTEIGVNPISVGEPLHTSPQNALASTTKPLSTSYRLGKYAESRKVCCHEQRV